MNTSPVTEGRQSEILADWLDRKIGTDHPGGNPPDEVDGDVLEAVYALRPELAPPPKTSILEILSHLNEADATRRLLDQGADVALDDEVQEAIYALAPHTAPAPTVSLDAILAKVTAGPLASSAAASSPTEGQVIPFPGAVKAPATAANPAAPMPVVPANRPARSWMRVLAGSGAVGLVAVAAAAALFILPNLSSVEGVDKDVANGAIPTAAPLSAPAGAISSPMDVPRDDVSDEVAVDGSATDVGKVREAGYDPNVIAPDAVIPEVVAARPQPVADAPAKAKAPREEAVPADPEPYGGDAVVDGLDDLKKESEEQYWGSSPGGPTGLFDEHSTSVGTASTTPSTGVVGGYGAGSASGGEVGADDAEDERRDKPRTRGAGSSGASASNMATPPPPAVAAEAPAPVAQAATAPPEPKPTTATTESKSSGTKDASSAPKPTAPGLQGADPALVARLGSLEALAKSYAAGGLYADAGRTLISAIVAPREAGQYYAAMSAEWFLDANDLVAAQDAVARGYALGNPIRPELQRAAAAVSRADLGQDAAKPAMDATAQ